MKNSFLISICLMLIGATSKANYWTQKASFPGMQAHGGFSFSITGKGYIGCGYQYDNMSIAYKHLWMYDPLTNSWSQKADFAGDERYFAAGVSINGKGYAGLGSNQSVSSFNDWFEYDPAANTWTQKSSCLLLTFEAAVNTPDFGYVITSDGSISQYNPISDTWQLKAPFPSNLSYLKAFAIGNFIYAGGGYDNQSNSFDNSFYLYSELNNTWQPVASFPGTGRFTAVSFSIGQKGYYGLGMGTQWPLYYTDFWQYNSSNNQWGQAASYPGVPRDAFFNFATTTNGFAGIGAEMLTTIPVYFNDFWEYTPGPLVNVDEYALHSPSMKINPNIVSSECNILLWNMPASISELMITDVAGKVIYRKLLTENGHSFFSETISMADYKQGIYNVILTNKKFMIKDKFVKVNW